MAKPSLHYGKYRIRWVDADGKRQSEVYDDRKEAEFALRRHQLEVEEIARGLRQRRPPKKVFDELSEYWLAHRMAYKRSPKDDISI